MPSPHPAKANFIPGDRIRFIAHHGKQILLVDLSHCSATEVEKVFRELPGVVTTHPRGSLLILSDFTGASVDEEAMRVMKETAVFDKPYVKKSASVAAGKIPSEFVDMVQNFSRRDFPAFKTREDALEWLVED
ncbi:MAG: hypothetical protein WCA20_36640 [Candidatus Sulfotelmatobacter sp.]